MGREWWSGLFWCLRRLLRGDDGGNDDTIGAMSDRSLHRGEVGVGWKVWVGALDERGYDLMRRRFEARMGLGAPFIFSFFGLGKDGGKGRITIHEATSYDE